MDPSGEVDNKTAPVASEPQQMIPEGRATITPPPSKLAARIEKALSKLELLLARVSKLREASGPRPITGDIKQSCLAFIEMELHSTIESLKLIWPNFVRDAEDDEWIMYPLLFNIDALVACSYDLIRSSALRHNMLLRKAAQYSRSRKSFHFWDQLTRFSSIAEHPGRYSHNHLPAATSHPVGLPPHAAEAGGIPLLVGIDRPIKKLLRWLTPQETDRSLRVMCIVGPAGIGKTALAMEIHNRLRSQTSRAHYHDFQCNVMVRVSQRSDSNELLLQDILTKISDLPTPAPTSDKSQATTIQQLVCCVSERLQHKRYFICIDDMREEEESGWATIQDAFPDNNLGSRVLVTTRSKRAAQACCSLSDGLVHQVKPLNQADSERLLLTRAFGSLDAILPNNVKLLIGEILMRSEGVPLFITSMADWLFENQRHHHQEEGTEEQFTKIAICDEELATQLPKQLEQALSSVYEGLPYDLKILSMYISMVPYGYKFDKDYLTTKWCYDCDFDFHRLFTQLVESNVITRRVAPNNKIILDEAEACQWQVSSFFQQFAVRKCAEMGFAFTGATLKLVAAQETDHGNKTMMPRRLALHHPDSHLPSLLEKLELFRIRSLAVSGVVCEVPLEKFINLVVLDLEGWENLTDEVLQQVCTSNMFFLQYLSIRNTQVSKLPHEIKKLCSLMVLDIGYTQISELPLELFELGRLFELDLRGTRIRQLPNQIVGLGRRLYALFLGGEGKSNPTATATRLPHGVRNLCKLEILATIDLSEEPASFISALGDLKSLRVLAITWTSHQCTDKAYGDALIASIQKWEYLKALTIHCGLGCSMEFLGSLSFGFMPPRRLMKFKVTTGRFANVPKWIGDLNLLSFVQITVCKQGKEDIEILGTLPILKCLMLGLDFIPTEAVVIESGWFPMLETFSVDCPMPWLIFSRSAMRKLTYLQLKFRAIPARQPGVPSDIGSLQSLDEIDLCYNKRYDSRPSVMATVEAVRKQVANHLNPIDLFVNGIQDHNVQAAEEETGNRTGAQSETGSETKDDVQPVDEKLVEAATQIQSTSEIEEV